MFKAVITKSVFRKNTLYTSKPLNQHSDNNNKKRLDDQLPLSFVLSQVYVSAKICVNKL